MNLALFLPNWVGDLVMATPTLRAVRRHFGPSARIVGILPSNEEVPAVFRAFDDMFQQVLAGPAGSRPWTAWT